MLPSGESDTDTAVAVPYKVTSVVVHPSVYIEGNTVEEHIRGELLVCIGGHDHKSVILGLPAGKNDNSPIAVLSVDVVVVAAYGTLRAYNLLAKCLKVGSVARDD